MHKNSLSTIEDLSNQQIEDVLELAQEMQQDLRSCFGLASGYIMASLFLEPSTRTRGSFESAMKRLGGQTITTADASTSSLAKGESLADTIRVWSGYADLIVMRHPWEGSARLSAEYATVPVVNAGDGGHEHPTQTLCDLLTLKKEHGALEGLRVALCGDLKNGRTVHSLTLALLRFGAQIIFVPGEGLDLPDYLKQRIVSEYGVPIERVNAKDLDLGALFEGGEGGSAFLNAVYMTPTQPHQLAMHQQDAVVKFASKGRPLALYMTRKQKEREGSEASGAYPKVNARIMSSSALSKAVVMHPLPRVDELAIDMDKDPRSKYFEQAWNGVPIRMALISLLLGLKPWCRAKDSAARGRPQALVSAEGLRCHNPICVVEKESQNAGIEVVFYSGPSPWFLCKYCERQVPAEYFLRPGGANSHPIQELTVTLTDQVSRLRFFADGQTATDAGFPPALSKRSQVIEVKG